MTTVAIVGLGYVGLPLAVEFGKKFPTIGFDPSAAKVEAYKRHLDPTGEVSAEELKAAKELRVTTDPAALKEAEFVIVAVPTPIDDAHQPDFGPLLRASETVGGNLRRGATVVFESTVYPGARAPFRPRLEAGLLRRLLAGADQPRRQGAHAREDHQGGRGRHARDA